MANPSDIFGIGCLAVDDLLYVDHFPNPDIKMPVQAVHRQGGGLTATALVTAARHGAKTAISGCLGDDDLSNFTRREFEREGVDIAPMQFALGARPFYAVVIVDTNSGSRTILYTGEGVREPDPDQIDPAWVLSSKVLFIDHHAPRSGLWAARLAKSRGIPIVADFEPTTVPQLPELMKLVDHLIVSYDFARQQSRLEQVEDMVRYLSQDGRAATIVTWGANGCWLRAGHGEVCHIPAFKVQAVDTTGCGDIFHGAYAAAIARGESIAQAVEVASATAALKATRPGGRAAIPGLDEVKSWLSTTSPS